MKIFLSCCNNDVSSNSSQSCSERVHRLVRPVGVVRWRRVLVPVLFRLLSELVQQRRFLGIVEPGRRTGRRRRRRRLRVQFTRLSLVPRVAFGAAVLGVLVIRRRSRPGRLRIVQRLRVLRRRRGRILWWRRGRVLWRRRWRILWWRRRRVLWRRRRRILWRRRIRRVRWPRDESAIHKKQYERMILAA